MPRYKSLYGDILCLRRRRVIYRYAYKLGIWICILDVWTCIWVSVLVCGCLDLYLGVWTCFGWLLALSVYLSDVTIARQSMWIDGHIDTYVYGYIYIYIYIYIHCGQPHIHLHKNIDIHEDI